MAKKFVFGRAGPACGAVSGTARGTACGAPAGKPAGVFRDRFAGGEGAGGSGGLGGDDSVLILNPPSFLNERDFYLKMLRVPETVSRLRQYRDILRARRLPLPLWLYGANGPFFTEKTGRKAGLQAVPEAGFDCPPGDSALNLIVSLALFDRCIAKQGWPRYLVGAFGPLLSVVTGEETFEEAVLAGFSTKTSAVRPSFGIYKVYSYKSERTQISYLTRLKKLKTASCLEDILFFLSGFSAGSPPLRSDSSFEPDRRKPASGEPAPRCDASGGSALRGAVSGKFFPASCLMSDLMRSARSDSVAGRAAAIRFAGAFAARRRLFFAANRGPKGLPPAAAPKKRPARVVEGAHNQDVPAPPLKVRSGRVSPPAPERRRQDQRQGRALREFPAVQLLAPSEAGFRLYIEDVLACRVQDFLERDSGLRELWPLWQKAISQQEGA